MKTFYAIAIAVVISFTASAQCSVIITQSTNVSCFGNCDGSATATAAGLPPYTYSWSPGGQTVSNPSGLCPGTYTVTMIDGASCQSTATVTITQPQDISITTSVTGATCNGLCNGHAQATPTGGTSPYNYAWTDPQSSTTDTANSLCVGSYTCTVTDFNGCTKFTVVSITQPVALSDVITISNATCFGSCNGIAAANAMGGTSPYMFAWSSGCNTSTCGSLCAGGYSLMITDANNCVHNDSAMITQPTQIIPNASETDASCLSCNDGIATCSPSGGTGPYSYSWSPGGQTTQTIAGLAPGNYVVCVTDAGNCSNCDTVTVSASNGIAEHSLENYFSIYQDAAAEIIIVHSEMKAKVVYMIYDVTGNEVRSGEFECVPGSNKEIPLADLNNGMYLIRLNADERSMVKRVMKF